MPTVKTPNYKVEIDKDFDLLNKYLHKEKPSKLFVLVDENTKEHCLPILQEQLDCGYELLEVVSGENNKALDTCVHIWQQFIAQKADRKSMMINLGGGVIGDMGGWAAASYMRGIPFIHMPTTLLSMVDASIGGKVGVDFSGYKNMLGCFQDPALVWIHSPFLKTLDNRELLSGFAEVIKHGLIQSKSLWETIKIKGTELDESEWGKVIHDSVKIKNKVVSQDPKEKNIRKILNFGHTIGHAIESHFLRSDQPLLHGEAIAKGMIAEAYLSFKTKRITIIEMEEINSLLESIYKLPDIKADDIDHLLKLMTMDKKNEGGKKMMSLLNGIGKCDYDIEVTNKQIKEALAF